MNSESTAIVALILILLGGFLAFVFFSNGNEPNAAGPNEPTPVTVNIGDTRTDNITPGDIEMQPEPSPPVVVESPLVNSPIEDLIVVTTPLPLQDVTSPLIVEGKARGYWFFEADFPIMLTDSNGNIIARDNARAKSDWMTENFVKFSAKLEFTPDYGKPGVLIIRNNNPSDLKENNRELKIPIAFAEREMMVVQVYFGNRKIDPELLYYDKSYPTPRIIPKTQAVARAALEELLKGPTEQELEAGFYTCINEGVKIQSISITNGVARVDFDSQLEFQVGGSAMVQMIRAQITQTLIQFSTVNDVIISIDGRTEDILQP